MGIGVVWRQFAMAEKEFVAMKSGSACSSSHPRLTPCPALAWKTVLVMKP
jgi:hypothetical protein